MEEMRKKRRRERQTTRRRTAKTRDFTKALKVMTAMDELFSVVAPSQDSLWVLQAKSVLLLPSLALGLPHRARFFTVPLLLVLRCFTKLQRIIE